MLIVILSVMAVSSCFVGCGAQKAEAQPISESQSVAEVQSATEESNEDSDKEYICGGFTASENTELTDETKQLFDKAIADLTGVEYEPIAYLGSQVVAGTNHAILCKVNVVSPNATPYYTIMYIYEDLEGNVSVLGFSDVELGDYE